MRSHRKQRQGPSLFKIKKAMPVIVDKKLAMAMASVGKRQKPVKK